MTETVATHAAALRRMLEMQRDACPWPDGYVYRGGADFVLQHGRVQIGTRLAVKPAQNRACFGNSLLAAHLLGWRYVEGFALNMLGLPIHHAWVINDQGEPIDLTWGTVGTAYIGVEFDPLRADDATWNGDASILDDWMRGYPLFKQPWTGEPEISPFTPTEVLLKAKLVHEHLPGRILDVYGERR